MARYAPRHTHIATAPARRWLHASTSLRAAPPPAAPPAGDPNKPDNDDGSNSNKDGAASTDENIFGENGLNSNGSSGGETQGGRQRRRINGAATRGRRRVTEELPTLMLPEDFQKTHVYRSGDAHESPFALQLPQQEQEQEQQQDPREHARQHALLLVKGLIKNSLSKDVPDSRLREIASHEEDVSLFLKSTENAYRENLKSQPRDVAAAGSEQEGQDSSAPTTSDEPLEATPKTSVPKRSKRLLIALFMALTEARKARTPKVDTESTESSADNGADVQKPDLCSRWLSRLSEAELYKTAALIEVICQSSGSSGSTKSTPRRTTLKRTAILNIMDSGIAYGPYLGLGGLHHQGLQEVVSSIRAELALACPKSIKSTDVRRPVTILDFPYYRGSSWPRHVLNDVANEVGANVLHLTAQDLGHVVGPYLGQDISRAAGSCSLLPYHAASQSGRLRKQKQESEEREGESQSPMGLFIVDTIDKSKRDTKKSQSLLEGLFGGVGGVGGSNREKSDDMWEDLKLNTALEQLIIAAESDADKQKPLIIHIHDYNALSLASHVMLNKLRKTIDTLWSEGRNIILVGSCSSQNAPWPYLQALKHHGLVEHVITLHASRKDKTGFLEDEQNDFLEENTTNIKATLHSLLTPSDNGDMPEIRFNMQLIEDAELRASFCDAVLPFVEVYRICKAMIGGQDKLMAAFDQPLLEAALRLVQSINEGEAGVTKTEQMPDREGDSSRDMFTAHPRGAVDPRRENHEERLLSGLVNADNIKTTFNDIHVPKETIASVRMLTQLSLQRPEAFSYGVLSTDRIPGCLLYGPPGTGKTLLAKAVAKESGANMIEVSAATINNLYVGESEKNVRALFSLARKKEPMIIFIDEADALLGARGQRPGGGDRRVVMNQFLREWDGMDAMKAFIMVATNRPFDLDDAILRRLPRKLLVDLPLESDRAAILRIHLKGETLDDSVSIEELAKQTPLYSGSDLKNVCVAAAMSAVKEELDASDKHTGPEPYVWAEKRVLSRRHFDKGLAEISASVSEDMATMNAIRKFDERYGDNKSKRKRKGMGFGVLPEATDSHEARVRGANQ